MPEKVDLAIHPQWIIPVEPDCNPLLHHSVVINQGKIHQIVPTGEYSNQFESVNEHWLPHHVIMPGLVNAHTHAAMTLFRGMADDISLMQWLTQHIWPAEQYWVDEQFVRTGTRLALVEMLSSGTTCFNDMYFFPNIVADVAQSFNMRAAVGLIILDFPTAWGRDAEGYLRKGIALHDELKNLELVTTTFAPHAPYTVSDAPLKKIRVIADELDIPIHMHVHETEGEIGDAIKQQGLRPLERLSQLGLLNDRLLAVHMTQLHPEELDAVASSGVNVIHCPQSNLKLASGLCPVHELVNRGTNVALGTDGAASNNDLDMLAELQTAALLAKGVSKDPTALPAESALRMATINGAKALGLEELIGSITPGKCADIIAIDLNNPATTPVYDPVAQIVYAAGRDQVTHVWINGRCLMEDNNFLRINSEECVLEAHGYAQRIKEHRQQEK